MSGLDRLVDQGLVTGNAELSSLTTYRFGGPARYLAEPSDRKELDTVIEARAGEPVLVVGRGSNLVISDAGFDGLVIRLVGEFESVTVDGELVEAGGAAWLPTVALGAAAFFVIWLLYFRGVIAPGSFGSGAPAPAHRPGGR